MYGRYKKLNHFSYFHYQTITVAWAKLLHQLSFICSNSAHFGEANSNVPILLDDVRCTGQEASITDCVRSDWYVHNCRHYEDAGVSCTSRLLRNLNL